jgi:integrase
VPTEPVSFPVFTARLLSLYAPPLRARATRLKVRQVLTAFAELPGVETTYDLTTHQVAAYASTRGGNVNTLISHLRCLRTASLYAHAEGWLERPPQWKRLMPRATPPCRKRHHSHAEVVQLLDHLRRGASQGWRSNRIYVLTAIVAYCGLRRNEASRLQIEDVRLADRLILIVPRHRLKTESSAAPVPIPEELVPILERWLPEAGPTWVFPGVTRVGPWTGGSPGYRPGDWLAEAGDAVGIEGLTFHSLRHTLAKLLVHRFDATADQAKSMLRHGSIRTTEEFYLHRDDAESLRRIVRKVSFRNDAA